MYSYVLNDCMCVCHVTVHCLLCRVAYDLPVDEKNYLLLKKLGLFLVSLGNLLSALWVRFHPCFFLYIVCV